MIEIRDAELCFRPLLFQDFRLACLLIPAASTAAGQKPTAETDASAVFRKVTILPKRDPARNQQQYLTNAVLYFPLPTRLGQQRRSNVDSRTFLPAAACALALSFCAASSAQAAAINVTYDYSVSAVSGDPLNPPIVGVGAGSVSPLESMTWMDIITDPNPATGEADGTFTMTFSTGDTLFGDLHEQLDLSSPPIVPFTQILTVTGGTGALLSYRGTLTGGGSGNLAENILLASGAGTLDTIPEPSRSSC